MRCTLACTKLKLEVGGLGSHFSGRLLVVLLLLFVLEPQDQGKEGTTGIGPVGNVPFVYKWGAGGTLGKKRTRLRTFSRPSRISLAARRGGLQ